MRCVNRNFVSLLAIAGMMVISPAFAQDAGPDVTTRKGTTTEAETASAQIELPSCLLELNLTQEQQNQIQTTMRRHEADIAVVWKQFSDCYMDAIRTEAVLQCVIEDNLNDAQRAQVRDQRRRVAQRQPAILVTPAAARQAADGPKSPIEEHPGLIGVALTPEQESAAEKLEESYGSSLRSHNRDIAELHTRLLSLEADKFVEIEKVLTADQLKKLCELRKSAPPVSRERVTSKNRTTRNQ